MPSDEEMEIASNIEGKVCFRNALFFDETACVETCDYVLGAVPLKYLKQGFELWGSEFLTTHLDKNEIVSEKIEEKPKNLGWISNA